jgi:hypothetical protein
MVKLVIWINDTDRNLMKSLRTKKGLGCRFRNIVENVSFHLVSNLCNRLIKSLSAILFVYQIFDKFEKLLAL